jgi:5-formyltetrahydrofolate cyclo-ligase
METWEEVRQWRRARRAELLSWRMRVPQKERPNVRSAVIASIKAHVPELRSARIGFYWPFKAEIDLRGLVRDLEAAGAEPALPVVVEKKQPLEFWAWRPRMKLSRGVWNIPIPEVRTPVAPTALLAPLVGFDGEGYRIGYGGGYYDRTLAAMNPRPLTIGVGYELGRLATIHPQPHDIPLDAIVTEAGFTWFRRRGAAIDAAEEDPNARSGYASPPCYMHELDPSYLGYLNRDELVALLNRLLEAERAGARGLTEMSKSVGDPRINAALRDVAKDEGRFCAMLASHIGRLGGEASQATGTFYQKLMATDGLDGRLDLLDRGQGWVVRELREALPRIQDPDLHGDLSDMLAVHERNIERCSALS